MMIVMHCCYYTASQPVNRPDGKSTKNLFISWCRSGKTVDFGQLVGQSTTTVMPVQ